VELQSIEGGADAYITKPFDKDILLAKVENLFNSRNELQKYFFNEVTLQKNTLKISPEYKAFLDKCIAIVEQHLHNDQFTIKILAQEIGMSHSYLYKKVRQMSGQSVAGFIRYIRLRKAAELMIRANCNVNDAAFQVGINDVKYFRRQFNKLFGMNPSEYIKKFRDPFNKTYQISTKVLKEKP
jgi:AraC-like DNA-binding protein